MTDVHNCAFEFISDGVNYIYVILFYFAPLDNLSVDWANSTSVLSVT